MYSVCMHHEQKTICVSCVEEYECVDIDGVIDDDVRPDLMMMMMIVSLHAVMMIDDDVGVIVSSLHDVDDVGVDMMSVCCALMMVTES